jgi:hypothetical protein
MELEDVEDEEVVVVEEEAALPLPLPLLVCQNGILQRLQRLLSLSALKDGKLE